MGLVRARDELDRREEQLSRGSIASDVRMLLAIFRTDPDVVRRVLPPPLEPAAVPTGTAYVAEFRQTNYSPAYVEAAVFLSAQYQGEVGNYCVSMPLTNDAAMFQGRERSGYPKKIAESVRLEVDGVTVTGTCVRRGIRLLRLSVRLEGPFGGQFPSTAVYLIKAFRSVTNRGFEYPPILIKLQPDIDWGSPQVGTGQLSFGKSEHDPIHEIPIEEIVLAGYSPHVVMTTPAGEVLTKIDPEAYRPYYWAREDWDL